MVSLLRRPLPRSGFMAVLRIASMNGGIVSNHDILERFSAFDAKLTVTKFLREDFAHFNALNDYNALVRLKPGEVSEAFLTEDIMGNQLAKIVKLVDKIIGKIYPLFAVALLFMGLPCSNTTFFS